MEGGAGTTPHKTSSYIVDEVSQYVCVCFFPSTRHMREPGTSLATRLWGHLPVTPRVPHWQSAEASEVPTRSWGNAQQCCSAAQRGKSATLSPRGYRTAKSTPPRCGTPGDPKGHSHTTWQGVQATTPVAGDDGEALCQQDDGTSNWRIRPETQPRGGRVHAAK